MLKPSHQIGRRKMPGRRAIFSARWKSRISCNGACLACRNMFVISLRLKTAGSLINFIRMQGSPSKIRSTAIAATLVGYSYRCGHGNLRKARLASGICCIVSAPALVRIAAQGGRGEQALRAAMRGLRSMARSAGTLGTVLARRRMSVTIRRGIERGTDRPRMGGGSGLPRSPVPLLNVERLGAGRLAGGIERDFLDARLGLAQKLLATALECLAAFVDGDRFLERHLALFEPLDDRFEFLDRAFEGEAIDIGSGGVGHAWFPYGAGESRLDFSSVRYCVLILHQGRDVGRRRIGEAFEIVTAFKHRYHAALGAG